MLGQTNQEKSSVMYRTGIAVCFIVFAAVPRIMPHPWNFTPVGAMALFSGAKLGRSWKAFVLPLAALFCGDLFLGFHWLMPVVYLSFCVSVLIGIAFRNRQSLVPLAGATFAGALQFFLITNFAIWAWEGTYPHSAAGLTACYIAGIPFFGNTLAGDAFYVVVFFGGFALLERLMPTLRAKESDLSY
jgi:hypothetical protein